ncbi:hypothetical protein HK100_003116 [Physocladia obscura]|uniref:Heterokaryon incompatibility domain-containing protein n=1 Tax=Physocladia obscura TaxID=109957 RepID=A0AAD5XEX4_9FUNG|nr:hypothetical protein HK100_003116 [Physocladia obscura]
MTHTPETQTIQSLATAKKTGEPLFVYAGLFTTSTEFPANEASSTYVATYTSIQSDKYATISHVWGNNISLHNTKIPTVGKINQILASDSEKVSILENVLDSWDLPIWCDVYSIDQNSAEDKAAQVSIMDKIYENAAVTYTILTLQDYSILTNILAFLSRVEFDESGPIFSVTETDADGKSFESLVTLPDGNSERIQSFVVEFTEMIKQLKNMDYSCRVWTMQEAHLSKKVRYTTDGVRFFDRHKIIVGITAFASRLSKTLAIILKPQTVDMLGLNNKFSPDMAVAILDAIAFLKMGIVEPTFDLSAPEMSVFRANIELAGAVSFLYLEFVSILGLDFDDRANSKFDYYGRFSMAPPIFAACMNRQNRRCSVKNDLIFGHYKLLLPDSTFDYSASIHETYAKYQCALLDAGFTSLVQKTELQPDVKAYTALARRWVDEDKYPGETQTWTQSILALGFKDRRHIQDRFFGDYFDRDIKLDPFVKFLFVEYLIRMDIPHYFIIQPLVYAHPSFRFSRTASTEFCQYMLLKESGEKRDGFFYHGRALMYDENIILVKVEDGILNNRRIFITMLEYSQVIEHQADGDVLWAFPGFGTMLCGWQNLWDPNVIEIAYGTTWVGDITSSEEFELRGKKFESSKIMFFDQEGNGNPPKMAGESFLFF